jgi:hypothetical protein
MRPIHCKSHRDDSMVVPSEQNHGRLNMDDGRYIICWNDL